MDEEGQQGGLKNESIWTQAKFQNKLANLAFIILLVIFNVLFWTTAFMEHFRPAEYFLRSH